MTTNQSSNLVPMHPDFAHLQVWPGEMMLEPAADPLQFGLLNVLAFGGAADKGAHMPAVVGELGDVVLWESTGAADALPFWNTNFAGDVYLLLMQGDVRVEFKQPDTDVHLGTYLARTGDLMKLPRAIAHRTFSTSGKRRISVEIVARNPLWKRIGEYSAIAPATDDRLDDVAFVFEGDTVVIRTPADHITTSREFFVRGLRVLLAYELHLEHNEFDGGFSLRDLDSAIELRSRRWSQRYPPAQVIALFKGMLGRHG
ncbi:MAG: hypothetical protein NVSMB2_24380 [Chloroflexota bacterium]